ncbi:two-component system sensor histidine kinase NtrB [Desulforamulus hydrothermalis]|uniref:two-component system sensor histidine kinase NtrB n=1 Tax=Desulforamulus hydrothermalis TaxID=412895 RepID=UPI003B75CAE9
MLTLTNQFWIAMFVLQLATFVFTHWLAKTLGLTVAAACCLQVLLAAGPCIMLYRRVTARIKELADKTKTQSPVVFQDLPVPLIVADKRGQITAINDLAGEICGISDLKEPINLFALSFTNDNPLFFLAQTLKDKQVYHEQHYIYQREDDLKYYLLCTAEILKKDGQSAGAMLIALPVTEHSLLSNYLSQRGKLAMISELAAGTAHEIRNPLTTVQGLIQLLSRRFQEGDPAREYVAIMLQEIGQINRIINELLQLARRRTPNLSFASLPAVLDKVLLTVAAEANRRSIIIEKQYNHRLPLMVLDEDQIQQAFWHLASNAIHAMPYGGTLTVAARYLTAEDIMEITFTDTGTGIPREKMTQIFYPFFTTRPEATGLGLPVSYQIIDNHGGRISVKSLPGKGSTFTVKLPLVNYEKAKTP